MSSFEYAGRRYEMWETYRLDIEAYSIELMDLAIQTCVAHVICKEGTSQLLVNAEGDIAVELVEKIIAIARERLPEWEKNWDVPGDGDRSPA